MSCSGLACLSTSSGSTLLFLRLTALHSQPLAFFLLWSFALFSIL